MAHRAEQDVLVIAFLAQGDTFTMRAVHSVAKGVMISDCLQDLALPVVA